MAHNTAISSAPMSSAPMQYLPDGSVDWASMWDTFCALAQAGGPPHRGTMLYPQADPDAQSERYDFAAREIVRGIRAVSGLEAQPAEPGWIAVQCQSPAMAAWLSEAIQRENVQARAEGSRLCVPVGAAYTLKGEIKNVITVIAKTTHYWAAHLPAEAKTALAWEQGFKQLKADLYKRLRLSPAP